MVGVVAYSDKLGYPDERVSDTLSLQHFTLLAGWVRNWYFIVPSLMSALRETQIC